MAELRLIAMAFLLGYFGAALFGGAVVLGVCTALLMVSLMLDWRRRRKQI